ncbi:MAG: uroporphyrinogen decarboxylase [Solirubrobacteraceae bacterium]
MISPPSDFPGPQGRFADAPLLRALRNQPVDRVPVWFMRQAGRSLPEYRAVRKHASLFEICQSPELTAQVTAQPVDRLGVDAAVLFSDITIPLAAIGIDLDIVPNVGPVIAAPIRTSSDLRRLKPFEPSQDAPALIEGIRLLVKDLKVPLIGFAGGPFTLASYLVEGGPSKTHARTRALMYAEPKLWHELLSRLADIALASLKAQAQAGASVLQLFESWVGVLDPHSYSRHVLPATKPIFEGLAGLGVPTVYFGVDTGELLTAMNTAGSDALGVDWRVPMDAARRRMTPGTAVQGNLDPAACLSPWEFVREQVLTILAQAGPTGHVFNLGHGVLPQTDPDMLARIVDLVHQHSSATVAALTAEP